MLQIAPKIITERGEVASRGFDVDEVVARDSLEPLKRHFSRSIRSVDDRAKANVTHVWKALAVCKERDARAL